MKIRITFTNAEVLEMFWSWKLHEKFLQFLMIFNNKDIDCVEDFLKCPHAHLLFTFFDGQFQQIRWGISGDEFCSIAKWGLI